MFRLLRYFSVTSLLAFILVTGLLGIVYRWTAINALVQQAESKNIALAQTFANWLWPQFVPYLLATAELTPDELRRHPEIDRLMRAVLVKTAGLPVSKIKIYNLAGTTIFSTIPAQIGEAKSTNQGFLTASTGGVASLLNQANTFNVFDNEVAKHDMLGTYLPIRTNGSTGPIVGVFELYSDVTPLVQQIAHTQQRMMLGVAGILTVLYLVLFLIMHRAERILQQQQQTQRQVEAELHQQQQALAALKERDQLARELHDNISQVFSYVTAQTLAAQTWLAQGELQQADRLLGRMVTATQEAQEDVREQILGLRTSPTDEQDFLTALQRYLAAFQTQHHLPVALQVEPDPASCKLAPAVTTQLVRIIQEALTNARKHAQAHRVQIQVQLQHGQGRVTISDDGCGFDPGAVLHTPGQHFGLQIMQERAQAMGGNVQIVATPGQGSQVIIEFPVLPMFLSPAPLVEEKAGNDVNDRAARGRPSTLFGRLAEFIDRAQGAGGGRGPRWLRGVGAGAALAPQRRIDGYPDAQV